MLNCFGLAGNSQGFFASAQRSSVHFVFGSNRSAGASARERSGVIVVLAGVGLLCRGHRVAHSASVSFVCFFSLQN